MRKMTKIGEGVYGEVFKKTDPSSGDVTILKVCEQNAVPNGEFIIF